MKDLWLSPNLYVSFGLFSAVLILLVRRLNIGNDKLTRAIASPVLYMLVGLVLALIFSYINKNHSKELYRLQQENIESLEKNSNFYPLESPIR